jgi:hypothetical protein
VANQGVHLVMTVGEDDGADDCGDSCGDDDDDDCGDNADVIVVIVISDDDADADAYYDHGVWPPGAFTYSINSGICAHS